MNPVHGNVFIKTKVVITQGLPGVKVYADGSVAPSIMSSPTRSALTDEFYGRVCVLIPIQDFGLVERFTEGPLTKKGNPDTTNSEYASIVRALEVCRSKGLGQFVVYNDSQGAVAKVNLPEVKLLPSGEFNPASAFLYRVLNRAGYIRGSGRKTTKRMPPTPAQLEIYDLFQAERKQFRLSESAIWTKLQADLARGRGEAQ
jgi:hypothetical protein